MKKFRNILAMLMVFVMLVAVVPMNVFAADPPGGTVETGESDETGKTGDGKDAGTDEEGTPATEEDKKAAKATVNALENISKDDKETALKVIGEATTKETINGLVADAEAKDAAIKKAKDDAKKAVDALENLSGDEKKGFTDRIDAVTEINDIQPIVEEANKKAAENKKVADDKAKEEEKKALAKAKEDAKAAVDKLDKLSEADKKSFKDKIDKADNKADVDKILKEAKDKAKPDTTPVNTVKVVTIGNGSASVDYEYATKGQTVTVTAKPYSGYAVARVYLKYAGITKNINTYYNGYYYDGRYYGRYNDYNKYLDVYENSSYYLRKYDSYREFLRYEYPSHYRYYEDYDYWTDRYDYDWYNRYDNYYYKYFDDFRRSRYDTYEEYLRAEHYTHYRDYYNYRYDYNWYNRYGYTTTDTFEMPASNVTVYVEFTDAYPYYYDDYYYYRSRRAKEAEEAKAKAEAAKKEEEEAKAKAEAEKQPQIYENKAVISIGSNVLDKVSKNVHTVHQMDAPAYVNGGRVMLPLRYVAEALGLQVSWVPETKTVIIWDLTQRVEIPVKSNRIIVNGITYTSDVKPEIKNERTMLPIANIARALGLIDGSDIVWDQYNKQVTLTRKVLSK